MHLLLPPSEGKTHGGRGKPLRARMTDGPIEQARTTMICALLDLVGGDEDAAAAALLLPRGVAADALRVNRTVLDSPTTPALRRYAGTVYAGLDYDGLAPAARRVAERSVLIFSGLFGVVRGDEPLPAYRVPAKAVLPGLGIASSYWRPVLTAAMPALVRRGLIVDLRSSDYAGMWRPPATLRTRAVSVRVLSPLPRGGYGVISYASKLAKGRLARALVERVADGGGVHEAADVVVAWQSTGGAGAQATAAGLDLYTG